MGFEMLTQDRFRCRDGQIWWPTSRTHTIENSCDFFEIDVNGSLDKYNWMDFGTRLWEFLIIADPCYFWEYLSGHAVGVPKCLTIIDVFYIN